MQNKSIFISVQSISMFWYFITLTTRSYQ